MIKIRKVSYYSQPYYNLSDLFKMVQVTWNGRESLPKNVVTKMLPFANPNTENYFLATNFDGLCDLSQGLFLKKSSYQGLKNLEKFLTKETKQRIKLSKGNQKDQDTLIKKVKIYIEALIDHDLTLRGQSAEQVAILAVETINKYMHEHYPDIPQLTTKREILTYAKQANPILDVLIDQIINK